MRNHLLANESEAGMIGKVVRLAAEIPDIVIGSVVSVVDLHSGKVVTGPIVSAWLGSGAPGKGVIANSFVKVDAGLPWDVVRNVAEVLEQLEAIAAEEALEADDDDEAGFDAADDAAYWGASDYERVS